MTAWVAAELSLRQPGRAGADGMGRAATSYGILATHFYWIAAFPSMVFLGLVMMPFYYASNTHSVPGYLQLVMAKPPAQLSGISFARDDGADVAASKM